MEEQNQAMEITQTNLTTMEKVTNKERLCRRVTLLQALGIKAWIFLWNSRCEGEERTSCDTLARDKGNADYLST